MDVLFSPLPPPLTKGVLSLVTNMDPHLASYWTNGLCTGKEILCGFAGLGSTSYYGRRPLSWSGKGMAESHLEVIWETKRKETGSNVSWCSVWPILNLML